MNTNNKKHPEFLELNTTGNIGIVTIKQLEKIECALLILSGVLLISTILVVTLL